MAPFGVSGWIVAAVVLAAATVLGLWWQRRYGRLRRYGEMRADGPGAVLAAGSTAHLVLLQFSAASCGPCRKLRALCADVAASTPGVVHLEVDVAADAQAARFFNVWRVPTLLVLDPTGNPVWRTVGVPTRAALDEAVADVLERQVARGPTERVA